MGRVVQGLVGLLLAVGIVIALRLMTPSLSRALTETTTNAWVFVWLVFLGAGVGSVIVATRNAPLVSGVSAILLLILYLPAFGSRTIPTWYPGWLGRAVTQSFGSGIPLLIAGILGAAAVLAFASTGARSFRGEDT